MKTGYCRVSTESQSIELQTEALKQAGCKRIFIDKTMGAHADRPELTKCLKTLKAGDELMVWKLDRLGRSLRELVSLLDELESRDIAFHSVTESIDTTTPSGRAMLQMIGILANVQRSQILERTQAGRKAAVAKGAKMGRKRLLTPQQVEQARRLIEEGEHPRAVAKSYQTSLATLYRVLSHKPDST